MATESCALVMIHTTLRDTTTQGMKPIHRAAVDPLPPPAAPASDVSVIVSSARNVTDGSCSDPSETDVTAGASSVSEEHRKTTRKRSSRNMTLISRESETDRAAEETAADEKDAESITTTAQHADIALDHDFEVALSWHRNNRVLLQRLEEAAPRGKLSMINLTRRGIGQNEAVLLHEAIKLNPLLSVLKLSYNNLGDAGTTLIARAFVQDGKHHGKLSVLDLGFNSVGDIGCEALALLAVAANSAITALYLSGNRIGEKGAMAIAGAILHGSGLSTLHMTANHIGSKGVKALAGATAKHDASVAELIRQQQPQENGMIVPPTVTELHLGNTGIDSAGFIAIPGMVFSNCSIKALCLANNHINDQDILLLSQALTQNNNIPLERIELSFNEISDQGVECLMNALWGSTRMRVIKLDNNKMQDRGAQLCAVVLTSIQLEILELGFNRVTTVGIKSLMKNVSECPTLRTLGLSGIPVDQNASKALAYALAYNTSLTTLHLDNCSMGYSAQRHIVAGIISNRRVALRALTGFPIAQIAMTLGMPRLPESWSNTQLLGFVRLMWQQWLLKSGHGRLPNAQEIRGPAPPASVAAAAKIALSSLAGSVENLFKEQSHDRPFSEGPSVDPASAALMERTSSGTLNVPSFSQGVASDLHDWIEEESQGQTLTEDSRAAIAISPLEDPVRRNKNLKWLRTHFRSLSEVGRLPFNNADLWQLHQYYFSPPAVEDPEERQFGVGSEGDSLHVPQNSPVQGADSGKSLGRTVSFSSLGAAFIVNGEVNGIVNHKRTHGVEGEESKAQEPVPKRAKCHKSRIAYYPRIMAKIQSMGTRPMDQTLSLLRQLKYMENVIFKDKDPYEDTHLKDTLHQDVEMVLLDLL